MGERAPKGDDFCASPILACGTNLGAMSFLRCFSTLGCPELSLEAALALAGSYQLSAIEVRGLGGMLDLPTYLANTYGTPDRFAAACATHAAVRVVAFDTSLRLIGGTPEERSQVMALAPWAEAAGIRWLRVFDGGKLADAAELAEAAETLRWWRELRARSGWHVDMMVETHDALLSRASIGRFRTAFPDAALLWDAHHTWRKGGEDPVETWRAIHGAVVHVHVKDSIGAPSARHPFTYVLPGSGGFPIAPLLTELRANQFCGPVSLEWEKVWHPYLGTLAEALSAAATRNWW